MSRMHYLCTFWTSNLRWPEHGAMDGNICYANRPLRCFNLFHHDFAREIYLQVESRLAPAQSSTLCVHQYCRMQLRGSNACWPHADVRWAGDILAIVDLGHPASIFPQHSCLDATALTDDHLKTPRDSNGPWYASRCPRRSSTISGSTIVGAADANLRGVPELS